MREIVPIRDGSVLQKNSINAEGHDIHSIVKKVGYQKLTPVQQRVIPTILQGKDIIVETRNSRGKTAAFILPLIKQISVSGTGIKALIIAGNPGDVKKVEKQFWLFASKASSSLIIGAVGCEKNIKKELFKIKKDPDILVGTSCRIIDHFRRENIDISQVDTVVIYRTNYHEEEEFNRDIEFILAKISKKPQILYFTPGLTEEESLGVFPRKPQIISLSAQQPPKKESCYYLAADHEEKVHLFVSLALQHSFTRSFVVCRSSQNSDLLYRKLRKSGFRCASSSEKDIETRFNSGNVDILLTTFKELDRFQSFNMQNCIFFDLPEDDKTWIRFSEEPLIFFITDDETSQFNLLQETCNMSLQKEENPEKNQVLTGIIKRAIKKIKEEEDPDELNAYKRVVKKHVPITLRAYFTAYLLKESAGGSPAPSGEFKTLFVSIGKNRRVFPKDLVRLFSEKLRIAKSSIGGIKVLDNYSFIDIPETEAEKAISSLDGIDFHGRKITVNYARKKENDRS